MIDETRVGPSGISEQLWQFVEEMPYERRSILAFVRMVADSLSPGAVVLDVGAGDAPYRELFAHCNYVTVDRAESVHEGARDSDVIAGADALGLPDGTADAVLLTQVLEHVPDPAAVLREMARVLTPGGGLFMTVPFVWELHELPDDFWRFTPAALERLLRAAGFDDTVIEPRTDAFTTVAQLLRNLGWMIGRAPDGRNAQRHETRELLIELSERLAGLAALDVEWILPLGYTVQARRP